MSEEKPKTLKEIVDGFVSDLQSNVNKGPEERIKAFENYHDPKNAYRSTIIAHANELIRGGSDGFGAYHAAYKKLDELVKNPTDIVEKDHVEKMIEAYIDHFLERAHPDYVNHINEAKKKGLSDDEIRQIKKDYFGIFHKDENGQSIDPFSKQFIDIFRGKTKVEALNNLDSLMAQFSQSITNHYESKALQGLIKDEDRFFLSGYVSPILEKAGYKSKDNALTKRAGILAQDYSTYLKGGKMDDRGYDVDRYGDKKEAA